MRILYTGIQYSFYKKAAGLSFEHNNFYLSLKGMPGVEVKYLPFDRILEVGKKKFNEELFAAVKEWEPDLMFVYMLSDEVNRGTLSKIRKETKTRTLAWFSDDTWRFWNYSRWWAPYFDNVVTVYEEPLEWYAKLGIKNVIKSCWAANTKLYKPSSPAGSAPDVSLVGSSNKSRRRIIETVKRSGTKVSVYGAGWENGRISEEEMIRIFGQSRINLGLNEPNVDVSLKSIAKLFFRRSAQRIVPDFWHFPRNVRSFAAGWGVRQIKGRFFEIPACGGFLLAGEAKGLGKYYEPGKEIAVYKDEKEIPELVKYYMEHEEERKKIARAGYERTVREHTYEKRFAEIFGKIGIKI